MDLNGKKNLTSVTGAHPKRLHPVPSKCEAHEHSPRLWPRPRGDDAAGVRHDLLQTPSQRRPYDREASTLHPELTLHRKLDKGEVDVYLNIPREELSTAGSTPRRLLSRSCRCRWQTPRGTFWTRHGPTAHACFINVGHSKKHGGSSAWTCKWWMCCGMRPGPRGACSDHPMHGGPRMCWFGVPKRLGPGGPAGHGGRHPDLPPSPTPPAAATLPLTWRLSNAPAPAQLPLHLSAARACAGTPSAPPHWVPCKPTA